MFIPKLVNTKIVFWNVNEVTTGYCCKEDAANAPFLLTIKL